MPRCRRHKLDNESVLNELLCINRKSPIFEKRITQSNATDAHALCLYTKPPCGGFQYIHKREAVVHNLCVSGNGDSSIVQVFEQAGLTLLA